MSNKNLKLAILKIVIIDIVKSFLSILIKKKIDKEKLVIKIELRSILFINIINLVIDRKQFIINNLDLDIKDKNLLTKLTILKRKKSNYN